MTSACYSRVHGVQPALPPAYGLLGRPAVLEKVQPASGLEHSADLAQGSPDVGDGAQRERGQRGVDRLIFDREAGTIQAGPGDQDRAGRDPRLSQPPRQIDRFDGPETSGINRSGTPGPVLGLHLGMSGHVLITDAAGELSEGGDWLGGRYGRFASTHSDASAWDRFVITFGDGGRMRLFDPRRLGRVRLDPDLDRIGPDAELVRLADFSKRMGRGRAPVKARLLDQSVIAGVGNLLADETLWQAKISPVRPSDQVAAAELKTLHRALRRATKSAITHGGVHTGEIIGFRGPGRHCPGCGAEMTRATVGSRTTWWCPREQT